MSRALDHQALAAHRRLLDVDRPLPVFRRRELLGLGINDNELSAMLRRRLLVRLRHGVYAEADALGAADPRTRHLVDLAASIAAAEEPTWAFAGSAALVHGIPLPFDVPASLTLLRPSRQDERALARPSRHGIPLPNVSVTTHAVESGDVTVVSGLPVVVRPLAAIAVSREVSRRWKVVAFDAVLWDGSGTADDLRRHAHDWRSRGGTAEIVRAIDQARRGAQTPLETLSRLALVERGLPEPQLQVAFHDRAGLIGYTDMYWPGLGVVGEADGEVKYATREDVVREKVREDRLRALGLQVVRWMWSDIRERPDDVARRIRQSHRLSA